MLRQPVATMRRPTSKRKSRGGKGEEGTGEGMKGREGKGERGKQRMGGEGRACLGSKKKILVRS